MVELSPELRAKLDAIKDHMTTDVLRFSRAQIVRMLISDKFKSLKIKTED